MERASRAGPGRRLHRHECRRPHDVVPGPCLTASKRGASESTPPVGRLLPRPGGRGPGDGGPLPFSAHRHRHPLERAKNPEIAPAGAGIDAFTRELAPHKPGTAVNQVEIADDEVDIAAWRPGVETEAVEIETYE